MSNSGESSNRGWRVHIYVRSLEAIMRLMISRGASKRFSLCLLLSIVLVSGMEGQNSADFAGDWVLKIGSRTFLILSLVQASESTGPLAGSLARLQHLSSSNDESFSGIKGPVIHYVIVRSAIGGNCLSFTVQNPGDKNDQDNFQLCITGQGRGTLKIDVPNFEPWPVTKEKTPLSISTDWDSSRTYYLDDSDVSNSEMQRIFDEDQKDRQPGIAKIDWSVVSKADTAHREVTAKLLADGKLHTGEDFERAAFVFQHGEKPADYLLAHTLAMVAVSRGQGSAIWIAAATLDRYLQSIHQPQIYGTQFLTKKNEPTTQEPYDRRLIPDALRRSLGVPSQASQEEQRKRYDAERSPH